MTEIPHQHYPYHFNCFWSLNKVNIYFVWHFIISAHLKCFGYMLAFANCFAGFFALTILVLLTASVLTNFNLTWESTRPGPLFLLRVVPDLTFKDQLLSITSDMSWLFWDRSEARDWFQAWRQSFYLLLWVSDAENQQEPDEMIRIMSMKDLAVSTAISNDLF